MRTAFVTGGTGFIGRHLVDALLDRGVTRIELAGEVGVSASNIIAGVTEAPVILHTN